MTSCFAVDLRDDAAAIAEYERMHRPGSVWPEVIADLRAQGYSDIRIWRIANRLVMLTEREGGEFPVTWDSQTQAILDHWDAVMGYLQQPLPGHPGPPRWVEMKCVFDLREHAQSSLVAPETGGECGINQP